MANAIDCKVTAKATDSKVTAKATDSKVTRMLTEATAKMKNLAQSHRLQKSSAESTPLSRDLHRNIDDHQTHTYSNNKPHSTNSCSSSSKHHIQI